MMATAQQAHGLTSYYVKVYRSHYDKSPVVNRNTARWGFDSILMDMSVSQVRELIDFYLTTASTNGHSLDWLFYNYDKLVVSMEEHERSRAERKRLREESEERAREWRMRGNKGIADISISPEK